MDKVTKTPDNGDNEEPSSFSTQRGIIINELHSPINSQSEKQVSLHHVASLPHRSNMDVSGPDGISTSANNSLYENTKLYYKQANVLLMMFIFIIAGAFATISNHPNIGPTNTNHVVTMTGIKSLMEVPEGFYFLVIVTTICLVSVTMVIVIAWTQLVPDSLAFYLKSLVFLLMAATFITYAFQVQQLIPHFYTRIGGDYKISSAWLLWICSLTIILICATLVLISKVILRK